MNSENLNVYSENVKLEYTTPAGVEQSIFVGNSINM